MIMQHEPKGVRNDLRTIVVGVDGSAGAVRALAWAATRGAETSAELVAVHVLTYSAELATDLSLATITNWRRDRSRTLAGPWTDAGRSIGAVVRTVMVEDETPAAGILAISDRVDADLVVLGAHGRGNLADRLLGATTYTVAHRARTPVVIIPPDWNVAA